VLTFGLGGVEVEVARGDIVTTPLPFLLLQLRILRYEFFLERGSLVVCFQRFLLHYSKLLGAILNFLCFFEQLLAHAINFCNFLHPFEGDWRDQ
jgi:hypothetical protein